MSKDQLTKLTFKLKITIQKERITMYEPKKFSSIKQLDGISQKTMEDHYKLYEGYVKKANEIEEKLKTVDKSTANQVYSDLRELKLEYSFAVGGVKNHETYFGHLGGNGGEPTDALLKMIQRDFGSFDAWKEDLKQTGMAARGWVWLAFDWNTNKLFNYLGDAQNTFPVWDASVLLALDTYEHAYWADYGTARATYIDAFFKNLDWKVVEEKFKAVGIDKFIQ
ncbi:MAG: superoxide dismutase [Candidatus Doudnabacteria bacterium]